MHKQPQEHLAAPGGEVASRASEEALSTVTGNVSTGLDAPLVVYLAGGMKNGWQDRVIAAHPQIRFLDPRSHGLTSEDEYTEWDLAAIRSSDVVFAYMDTDNPSGFGLSLEVGYARALGKTVLYACEDTSPRQKYFGMVRCCSNVTFTSLDDAIAGLNNL